MKTFELIGPALDWAVAKCIGYQIAILNAPDLLQVYIGRGSTQKRYNPSTNWAQGGPIIEREEISIEFGRAEFKDTWIAYKLGCPHEDNPQGGPTPLIAAMRCYVASKLGDEIEIPEELK